MYFFIIKEKATCTLISDWIALVSVALIWTHIHLLKVNIQRQTRERARPAGGGSLTLTLTLKPGTLG